MCSIAGLMYFDDRKPTNNLLHNMIDRMEHREPVKTGFFVEGQVGLGHQPLSNEDESIWTVFNGQIYNYKSLKAELIARGHQFQTEIHAEIIVHLYEEYGDDCVHKMRGMFSFVIWDRQRQRMFAARDYFGIKPFYYVHNGASFVFASELKSILSSGEVDRKVQIEALTHYFTFQYVPEPMTMFADVKKLKAGHCLVVETNGQIQIKQYWDPSFDPNDARSFDDTVEEIRETLKQSVALHQQSDVERGCFLSSGIDSTAIAAMMRSKEPIKTFSVGFEGPNDETIISRETAKALETEHYAEIITRQAYFDSLADAAWHQEEPVADPSAIALYHAAKLAREHVAVVLSGEGADELFGGYRIYREPGALRPLSWIKPPLQGLLHQLVRMLPAGMKGRNYLLRATTPLERRFLGNANIFNEEMKAELIQSAYQTGGPAADPFALAGQYYDRTLGQDPVTRMQYIDLNLWLPGNILAKADKMTKAHSLELRSPFLDRDLFEIARTIPVHDRISNGTTKYVFRKAMEGVIPDFILHRPKLGFPVPLRQWIKDGEGDRMLEAVMYGRAKEMIDVEYAELLMKKHVTGQGDYARHLWTIYMFSLWYETFMAPEELSGAAFDSFGVRKQGAE